MTEESQQPDESVKQAAAAEAAPAETESRTAEFEARIEALNVELAAERDRLLRKTAEFDNVRKRLAAEAKRQSESGKLGLIQQSLAIADALEQALTTPSDKDTVEHLRQGVELTLTKLQQILREHGVERCESLGVPFDPNRHEALTTGTDESQPDGSVIQVVREGYIRGELVLRHAQVVVNQLS